MPRDNFLSRRDFLKLSGATLLGLFFSDLPLDRVAAAPDSMQGRVVYTRLVVRDAPAFQGNKVNSLGRDNLVDILEQVSGGAEGDYNRLWYRLGEKTYVYSGGVQPVQTVLNDTVLDIPGAGVVGEVTVPWADSSWDVNGSPNPGPRLYYATAHWIQALTVDKHD
jgi:hypothetical protein